MKPVITIKYNRFLDPIFIAYIQAQEKWKDWTPPSKEDVLNKIKIYNEEWKKYEDIVLNFFKNCYHLEFQQNLIEVYVVSGNPRPFSNPLVLKSGYSPQEFINILTHELTHKLFTQNKVGRLEKYNNESELTQNHIVLFAGLKDLYLNVLKEPERLIIDLESAKNHSTPDYSKAWEIVLRDTYADITERFIREIVYFKK